MQVGSQSSAQHPGAAGKGLGDGLKLFIEGRREKAKRDHDVAQAELDWQARVTEAKNEARRQKVREWRDGLANAHVQYQHWRLVTADGRRTNDAIAPNLVGMAWFQSLREHLATDGKPNEYTKPNHYRKGSERLPDDNAVAVLGSEISRIEREWNP